MGNDRLRRVLGCTGGYLGHDFYAVGDTSGSGYTTQTGGGNALMVKYDVSGNVLGGF